MLDFTRSREADFQDFGRWIWQQSGHFKTQEEISQFITAALFEEFMINGEPQLALVRIFRLVHANELPDNLRFRISPNERMALALTGTYGIELDWCDRRLSKGHQVVSLNPGSISTRMPLFREMLVQFGITVDDLRQDGTDQPEHHRGQFFVPNTACSPVISAQANFIRPYGIQSEIGFGGSLHGITDRHSFYFLAAFSCVPIVPEAALRFYTLQDYIAAALANQTHLMNVFDPAQGQ